jgi:hypothetical protein
MKAHESLVFAAVAAVALLVAVLGAGAIAAGNGAPASVVSTAAPSPTNSPSPSPSAQGVAALQTIIEKASAEQQQAFALKDPTLMRDTATAAYYNVLVQLDAALRSSGVTSIQLLSLTLDQGTIQGTTAQVRTTETWQATYADGSTTVDTTVNDYALVVRGGSWLIASDTQPRGNTPPGTSPSGPPTTVGATSRNWSGYVASGGTFTSVTGTWTVPTVTPTGTGADATWVGIGGATSSDLVQAGTEAVVDHGVVTYAAWTETLPQASQPAPLTIAPGDTVTVTISQLSAGVWSMTITDVTNGGTFTRTANYASSASSAEWIQEAPSTGKGVVLLDRFGSVRFSNASTVENGQTSTPAAAGAKAVTMVNSAGKQLATPSAIGTDGATFTVTRG